MADISSLGLIKINSKPFVFKKRSRPIHIMARLFKFVYIQFAYITISY